MEELTERKQQQPSRDIAVIVGEIKEIKGMMQRSLLLYAVEIGRRLVEAKQTVEHGEWGTFLKNEVEFSQSSANNFMRLFEEFGSKQISFFGAELKSQTFGNLTYSQALQLIALPESEREAFVKEEKVEEMSVRELQDAIRERNEAREAQKKAEEEAEELRRDLEYAEELSEQVEKAKEDAKYYENLVHDLEETIKNERKASENEKEMFEKERDLLRREKEEAERNPVIPEEKLTEIREEAMKAGVEDAKKNLENDLENARKAADEAYRKLEEAVAAKKAAESKAKEAENRLKTASPDITEFKVMFNDIQALAAKLTEKVQKIREADPETADKLQRAINAVADSIRRE